MFKPEDEAQAISNHAGARRTNNYRYQVRYSMLARGVAVTASFLSIPLMVNSLGAQQFGIWATLLAIMSWVTFFDFGVGNGLRNKVAECLATSMRQETGLYISAAYVFIGIVSIGLLALIYGANQLFSWQNVFNTNAVSEEILGGAFLLAATLLTLNFWLGIINYLLAAVQKSSVTSIGSAISNLMILGGLLAFDGWFEFSITSLVWIYGFALVTVNLTLSVWLFSTHPELRPRLWFRRRHLSPIVGVGWRFAFLQFCFLAVFMSDRVLVAHLCGPGEVTRYDLVFKYMSVITLLHGVIAGPMWSAYTDAFHRGDYAWIRQSVAGQVKIVVMLAGATVFLVLIGRPAIGAWIGQDMELPVLLLPLMGVLVVMTMWHGIFAIFANGTGQIGLQMVTMLLAAALNIPLSILFVRVLDLGVSGVVLGTLGSLLIGSIAMPMRYYRMQKQNGFQV